MKLVVFGQDQRLGYVRDSQIIDVSLAFAKYLRERQNERYPYAVAEQ